MVKSYLVFVLRHITFVASEAASRHGLLTESKASFVCRRQDEDDNMDEWDQDQLEKVVKQKHAAEASNKTDIICKFFLEAVEKKQYGWFWQCPNGGKDCKYRHALPPG